MEHVAGLNLAQWLSVTPLPPQAALLQVMDQLLEALECAHLAGVRHGDVKLTNVHHHQLGPRQGHRLRPRAGRGPHGRDGRRRARIPVGPPDRQPRRHLRRRRHPVPHAGRPRRRTPARWSTPSPTPSAARCACPAPSPRPSARRCSTPSSRARCGSTRASATPARPNSATPCATRPIVRLPEHGTRVVTLDSGLAARRDRRHHRRRCWARSTPTPSPPARAAPRPAASRRQQRADAHGSRFPTACCRCRRTTRGTTAAAADREPRAIAPESELRVRLDDPQRRAPRVRVPRPGRSATAAPRWISAAAAATAGPERRRRHLPRQLRAGPGAVRAPRAAAQRQRPDAGVAAQRLARPAQAACRAN